MQSLFVIVLAALLVMPSGAHAAKKAAGAKLFTKRARPVSVATVPAVEPKPAPAPALRRTEPVVAPKPAPAPALRRTASVVAPKPVPASALRRTAPVVAPKPAPAPALCRTAPVIAPKPVPAPQPAFAPVAVPAVFAQRDPAEAILALQICLDRRGFSCNTIDGSCGKKTRVAFATWCAVNGKPYKAGDEKTAWAAHFAGETDLYRKVCVTADDHAKLVKIPADPAGKAQLPEMGYQTIREKYAEAGHLSERMLEKLNPGAAWPNPPAGTVLTLPDVRSRMASSNPKYPYGEADVLRISLSRMEITVFDDKGKMLALFPCSIAADKKKLPPPGEIQVKVLVPAPNYTYTEEKVKAGGKIGRYIYPPGPNNPVGSSWIGLTLPTYGIHGTPFPEQIGRAESHGCFRLANWNAVRLRTMCDAGTSIVIER